MTVDIDGPEADELDRIVTQSIGRLMEHFDSVQVFVTKHCPAGKDTHTASFVKGDGNWYARYGQVKEWALKAERHSQRDVDDDRDDG